MANTYLVDLVFQTKKKKKLCSKNSGSARCERVVGAEGWKKKQSLTQESTVSWERETQRSDVSDESGAIVEGDKGPRKTVGRSHWRGGWWEQVWGVCAGEVRATSELRV